MIKKILYFIFCTISVSFKYKPFLSNNIKYSVLKNSYLDSIEKKHNHREDYDVITYLDTLDRRVSIYKKINTLSYLDNLKSQIKVYNKINIISYLDSLEKKNNLDPLRIEKEESEKNIAQFTNNSSLTRVIIELIKNNDNPKKVTTVSPYGNFMLEDISKYNNSAIGGYNDIKEELYQIVDFLINPDIYKQYGLRNTRGVLLHGSPGNGKTLFARYAGVIANKNNVSFIACAGSEFVDKYVGVGSSKVRELFEFAREYQPTIIFIDEFDAIGKVRSGSGESSDSERDQTLNQLLIGLDGFSSNDDILVIAATNRIDMLDKALIRAGRFDRIIKIDNPDAESRKAILNIHLEKKPIDVDIDKLVSLTSGLSGAQIETLLNEATLYGLRMNELPVGIDIVEKCRDRIILGYSNKEQKYSDNILYRIAIHEIGHVLLALDSKYIEKPTKVSIDTKSSNTLGFTMFEQKDIDHGIYTREYLEDKIKVLIAGRVAEELIFGLSVTSGAIDDLYKALELAKHMITEYGMGKKLVNAGYSNDYRLLIDNDINDLINSMYNYVIEYLVNRKSRLLELADKLINNKVLYYDEII